MARRAIAIVLCAMLVMSAGCAGWGTDGPADPDDEPAPESEPDDENTTSNASADDGNTSAPPSDEDDVNETDDEGEPDPPNESTTTSDGESEPTTSEPTSEATDKTDTTDESDSADTSDEDAASDENDDLEGQSSTATPGGSTDETTPQEQDSGGQDESTDETGQTGDGDSSDTDDADDEQDSDNETDDGEQDNESDAGDGDEDTSDDNDSSDNETVDPAPGDEYEDSATGVIRVVDSDGDPIEGEPVTITPPATVLESEKEVRYTDENGEVVIELLAGEPTDVVSYTVEVRGEEQRMGIMSDEHVGVQEVVFEPTDRMYQQVSVITVVDENGDPVEGEPVETRHGMLGDEDEWEVAGETDAHGEIVLTSGTSDPSDVEARDVRVREHTITTFLEVDRATEQIQIDTSEPIDENEPANETNETAPAPAPAPNETNETGTAFAAAPVA